MSSICFFDLETKYLFEDVDSGYLKLSFGEKKERQMLLTPKLGLATACVLVDGSKADIFSFDDGQERELIDALDQFDMIIGHNVLAFDYPVLSSFFQGGIISKFLPKTCDTLEKLKIATNGAYIGLDDLAKQNLGLNKTLDSKTVPKLWRDGQKEKVRSYCRNDVELLQKIYYFGKDRGVLKYTMKDHGAIIGVGEVHVRW